MMRQPPGKSTEVRNVMRSEDITEPKDVIPTGRMARVIARRWEGIGESMNML